MKIMLQLTRIFSLFLCTGLFSLQAFAQNSTVKSKKDDARVERALKQMKSEYERDKDGNYEVTYQTTGNRTQTVFVSPDAIKALDSEIRLIFSFAQMSDKPSAPDIAAQLLEQNMENPNYWAISKPTDGKIIIANLLYIPADADGKNLAAAISIVASATDKIEEQLTKKDVY